MLTKLTNIQKAEVVEIMLIGATDLLKAKIIELRNNAVGKEGFNSEWKAIQLLFGDYESIVLKQLNHSLNIFYCKVCEDPSITVQIIEATQDVIPRIPLIRNWARYNLERPLNPNSLDCPDFESKAVAYQWIDACKFDKRKVQMY